MLLLGPKEDLSQIPTHATFAVYKLVFIALKTKKK